MFDLKFSPGQVRYPNNSAISTDAGFTFTNGRKLNSSESAILQPFPLSGAQGVHIKFGGTSANNATFSARIFLGHSSCQGPSGIGGPDKDWEYFGLVACTLSSSVAGVANGIVRDTEYMADTLVFTLSSTSTSPVGIGQTIETAYASPGALAYSPADDATAGCLVIPHLGWADFLMIDFDPTGGTPAATCFAMIARR